MNDDDNTITLGVTTTTGTEDAFSIYDTDTITVSDDYSFDFSNIDLNGFNYNPGIDVNQGDIKIHNDGDIKLGDKSLKQFMDRVEERLNILHPNPELEQKWDELKALGNKYRELEKELQEKEKMWSALKK